MPAGRGTASGVEVRPETRKWALLIGVDRYENATPLRFARADVKELARGSIRQLD